LFFGCVAGCVGSLLITKDRCLFIIIKKVKKDKKAMKLHSFSDIYYSIEKDSDLLFFCLLCVFCLFEEQLRNVSSGRSTRIPFPSDDPPQKKTMQAKSKRDKKLSKVARTCPSLAFLSNNCSDVRILISRKTKPKQCMETEV
jgi:hypothetical protein